MSFKTTFSLLSAGTTTLMLGAAFASPATAQATPEQIGVNFY